MTGDTKPIPSGAWHGLLAGIAVIIYFLAIYLLKREAFLSLWILPAFIIIVLFKITAAYRFWIAGGKKVAFKAALQTVFMVSVIGFLMWLIFFYVMLNFVDTELLGSVKQHFTDNVTIAFEEGKIDNLQMGEALGRIEKINLTPGATSLLYSFSLMIGFFYALIFAGITYLIGKDIAAKQPAPNLN